MPIPNEAEVCHLKRLAIKTSQCPVWLIDEAQGVMNEALLEAVTKWDASDDTLGASQSAYIMWVMKKRMIDFYRKWNPMSRNPKYRQTVESIDTGGATLEDERGGWKPMQLPIDDPADAIVDNIAVHQIVDGCGLTNQERQVIDLHYFHEMTLRMIGIQMGFTESRACQLHTTARAKLRLAGERIVAAA